MVCEIHGRYGQEGRQATTSVLALKEQRREYGRCVGKLLGLLLPWLLIVVLSCWHPESGIDMIICHSTDFWICLGWVGDLFLFCFLSDFWSVMTVCCLVGFFLGGRTDSCSHWDSKYFVFLYIRS